MRHHALEGEKEVGLRALAVAEALDIVDQQQIESLVAGVELAHGLGKALAVDVVQPHHVHEFLDVLLRGDAQNLGVGIVL